MSAETSSRGGDCMTGLGLDLRIAQWERMAGGGLTEQGAAYDAALCHQYARLGGQLLASCPATGCDKGHFARSMDIPGKCPIEEKVDTFVNNAEREISGALQKPTDPDPGLAWPPRRRSIADRTAEGTGGVGGKTCMYNNAGRTAIPRRRAIAQGRLPLAEIRDPKQAQTLRQKAGDEANQLQDLLDSCSRCNPETGEVRSGDQQQRCPIGPAVMAIINRKTV